MTTGRVSPGVRTAALAWAATAAGLWVAAHGRTATLVTGVVLAGGAVAAAASGVRSRRATVGALLLVVVACLLSAWARVTPLVTGPLAAGGPLEAVVAITGEPQRRTGTAPASGAGGWRVEADTAWVAVAGAAPVATSLPVVLLVDGAAPRVGSTVRVRGRAWGPQPMRGSAAAVVVTEWSLLQRPPPGSRAAAAVRDSLRRAVRGRPPDPAGLLPGLVLGDTSAQSSDLTADMRGSGLSHLTAVSGGNVAVVVLLVVALGRAVGLRRGPAQLVLVAAGVAGYLALVGPEPSVLRAGAMTGVALVGLATDVRLPGLDVLAWPVAVLLVVDPFLALSLGFAMSVLATAALLLVVRRPSARPTSGALRAVRLALLITAAAQVAVAPLVAGIGGGIPLGGLVANLVAAPAVVPATALGLTAGVVGTLAPAAGAAIAVPATWAAGWIAVTARLCADHLPLVPWPEGVAGAVGLALLIALVAGALALAGSARRRALVAVVVVAGAVLGIRPGPVGLLGAAGAHAWPPSGWAVVACDVGQGTALVLAAGEGTAVVVDAGPDPTALRGCLGRLGVRRVPLVVLSHFHADHVDGLRALLGLGVTTVVVSPLAEPADRAERVRRLLGDVSVPVHVAGPGERWQLGAVGLEVLWPARILRGRGSDPNNASVVLRGHVAGVSLLLGGDVEPAAQTAILAAAVRGPVDVLVVPHHGSSRQSPSWARTFRPRIALVTVGRDNDYGHPAPATLAAYRAAGALVGRTDLDGDVAVVVGADATLALARRTPG